jgi:uncharacterized protein (TIGR00369 family)
MNEPIDLAAFERRVLAAPFHRWLGLAVREASAARVVIAMAWREEMVSDPQRRYTHGGILASLIDIVADYAIMARIGRGVPTIDMRVDYHRAAMPGDLVATGTVIKLGSTIATAAAEIVDAEGRLIASGRGVYFTAEPKPTTPTPPTPTPKDTA